MKLGSSVASEYVCQLPCERKIRKLALQREVWRVVGPSSGSIDIAGSVTQLFIYAWDHYYTVNAVSSSGTVVVTCTLEKILR